jgi:hypothetical protein
MDWEHPLVAVGVVVVVVDIQQEASVESMKQHERSETKNTNNTNGHLPPSPTGCLLRAFVATEQVRLPSEVGPKEQQQRRSRSVGEWMNEYIISFSFSFRFYFYRYLHHHVSDLPV